MPRLLKLMSLLPLLLWFGCAQVEKEVKSIQEGFVQGYEETKKAVLPADSKPKPPAKTAEAAKPPDPVKPKEPPPAPPEPLAPKDLPPGPPPTKAEASPSAKTKATDEFILHKVRAGESLATIAKWYSGKSAAWKEIAPHNPGVQPFRLKAGQQIKVPKSLAVVHKDQPDYSTATGPPAGKKASRETEAAGESTSPSSGTLFGPK